MRDDIVLRARAAVLSEMVPKDLITDAVQARSAAGIVALQILARELDDDMLGRANAALALVLFGRDGLRKLAEAAHKPPRMKVSTTFFATVAGVAAGSFGHLRIWGVDTGLLERATNLVTQQPDLRQEARAVLVDYLIEEPQHDVMYHFAHALSMLSAGESYARAEGQSFLELIGASAVRWMALSESRLREYEQLLMSARDDEPQFQRFFEATPALLDPMASEIWSKPDFHGRLEADFLIRRFDNKYVVVEIETPGKRLYTAHQPTADLTHALQQARDYRTYLNDHLYEARQSFPGYHVDAECMVVLGREDELHDDVRRRFGEFNADLQRSQVLGFDALSARARAVRGNLLVSRDAILHTRLL